MSRDRLPEVQEYTSDDIDHFFRQYTEEFRTKGENQAENVLLCLRHIYQMALLRSDGVTAPAAILTSLYQLLTTDEYKMPHKVRLLAGHVMKELSKGEMPLHFSNNFQGSLAHYERKFVPYILPVLCVLCNTPMLKANVTLLTEWFYAKQPDIRSTVLPLLAYIATKHTTLLDYSRHIVPVEEALCTWLTRTTASSGLKPASTSLFSLKTVPTALVTELDGTAAHDMFTVLNFSHEFTEDQMFNAEAFSMIYSWLHMYINKEVVVEGVDDLDLTFGQEQPILSQNRKLSNATRETIISVCERILQQVELNPANAPSLKTNPSELRVVEEFAEATLMEVVRIYDLLCNMDSSLIGRFFPDVKKVYQRTNTRFGGQAQLTFLQFFLNHADVVGYDIEPPLRAYFHGYLNKHYQNAMLAFETLFFCNRNKEKLLSTTNVFTQYFPALLKLLAWFPRSCCREFAELLPSLVGPSTYVPWFHSILDLPLMVAAMEQSDRDRDEARNRYSDPNADRFRPLYAYLLRNEAGEVVSIWENAAALPLVYQFAKYVSSSPRTEASAKLVPALLEIFFEVLLMDGAEECLHILVPVIFDRVGQLFKLDAVRRPVRRLLVEKALAIFYKFPVFVATLKSHIIDVISDVSGSEKEELVIHLCWVVGEYAGQHLGPACDQAVMNDYLEALELVVYERMSAVRSAPMYSPSPAKSGFSPAISNPQSFGQMHRKHVALQPGEIVDLYTTRLMMTVISALTKLASRCQDLAPRVILALGKCIKNRGYFDSRVIQRANECVKMLKFPSIAAAVYGTPCRIMEKSFSHIDANSSLPFILQPTADYVPGDRLHPFSLTDVLPTLGPYGHVEDGEVEIETMDDDQDDEIDMLVDTEVDELTKDVEKEMKEGDGLF